MTTLYYIMDPMCSWCYAFASPLKEIESHLPQQFFGLTIGYSETGTVLQRLEMVMQAERSNL